MSDIVPPIPGVSLDQDGKILISRAWYRFLIAIWDRTGGSAGPSGGGGSTSSLDELFGDEFQRELLGTTNQVIVTDGTQMSGRTTFATPQDIDTAANVVFGSATLEGTGTGLTVDNNSVLGDSGDDTTTITGFLNPYVAFGNGTDWTAYTLGGVQFTSPTSAANNQAKAYIRLLQKPYTTAPINASDLTSLVGVWIGGNYAGATTTALPLYLGGMYTSAKQFPAVQIDTTGAILAMDTGVNGSFTNWASYSFQSDTNTGYRRTASGQTRVAGSGVDIVNFDGASTAAMTSTTTFFGKITGQLGTAADAAVALSGAGNGLYSVAGSDVSFTSNGTRGGGINSSQRWLIGPTITDDTTSRLQVEGALRLTTPLAVTSGGTGLATLTDHAVYVGNGTTAITALTVGQTGYALLGLTGDDPYFGQLSHLSLADVQGGITTDVFETTAFELTAFESGVTEYFHVLEADYDELARQRAVASVAINTTMTDDYATYVVTASAKTMTLPLITVARINRAWTVVQNCTGYVDTAPNVADSILLPGGSDTIRLDQIGNSLTVKAIAANTWVIV